MSHKNGVIRARLRCCASCEWIFKLKDNEGRGHDTSVGECPRCGFGHYGAVSCFGNRAYRYARTQEPYVKRRVDKYIAEVRSEVTGFLIKDGVEFVGRSGLVWDFTFQPD